MGNSTISAIVSVLNGYHELTFGIIVALIALVFFVWLIKSSIRHLYDELKRLKQIAMIALKIPWIQFKHIKDPEKAKAELRIVQEEAMRFFNERK